MNPAIDGVRRMMVRELECFERELRLYPDDDSVWKTAPGISNSAGNLTLHACGNLQHYLGAVLGNNGYVRNRDQEFARRSGTRAELYDEIQKAITAVQTVLPALSEETLARQYPEEVGGVQLPMLLFILHLSAHLAHHLGQAGYLRRVITAAGAATNPVSIKALA